MLKIDLSTKSELWNMLKFQQSLYEKGLTTWAKVQEIQKEFDSIKA
jgi:hypothetical protein